MTMPPMSQVTMTLLRGMGNQPPQLPHHLPHPRAGHAMAALLRGMGNQPPQLDLRVGEWRQNNALCSKDGY